jgi:hypothetical protein
VTLLEIISDAVKIGMGSFTGWLIVRSTRSHESKKELRRRSQAVIEQLVTRMALLHSANEEHWLFKKDAVFKRVEPNLPHLESALAALNEMKKHSVSIDEVRANLIMIGVKSGGPLLGDYFGAVNDLHRLFDRQPPPTEQEVDAAKDKAEEAYIELIIKLGAVFRAV